MYIVKILIKFKYIHFYLKKNVELDEFLPPDNFRWKLLREKLYYRPTQKLDQKHKEDYTAFVESNELLLAN